MDSSYTTSPAGGGGFKMEAITPHPPVKAKRASPLRFRRLCPHEHFKASSVLRTCCICTNMCVGVGIRYIDLRYDVPLHISPLLFILSAVRKGSTTTVYSYCKSFLAERDLYYSSVC